MVERRVLKRNRCGYTAFAAGMVNRYCWFAQCDDNGVILRQFGATKAKALEALYDVISILSTNTV